MKLGIIILNYNDFQNTIQLVNNIKGYKNIDEIVVVDNCSTDDSYIRLNEENDKTWKLIKANRNLGYANGNNIGIRYLVDECNIDIVGISNPDVIFSEKFIDEIKTGFLENPEYSILTGVQYAKDQKIFFNAFWKIKTLDSILRSMLNCLFLCSKVLRVYRYFKHNFNKNADVDENLSYPEQMLKVNDKIFSVDAVCGALFFAQAADFKDVGYFDNGTFLFFEEDILAFKLQKKQKKTGIIPSAKFIHFGSETIKKNATPFRKRRMFMKSQLYYVTRYLTKNPIIKILFWIITQLIIAEEYVKEKMEKQKSGII
jgi:hypothetical protein